MSIELFPEKATRVLHVKVSGKLDREDYKRFTPEVERLLEQGGKLRILLETHDFHGWTAGALWDDVKFDAKHFNDIEKLAVVGEKKWEEGMTAFCKPFTTAEVRFFEHEEREKAKAWVESD